MTMNKWRCLVKFVQQGSGICPEKVFVVKATDLFQAQRKARYFPGVKSHLRDCILSMEYFGKGEHRGDRTFYH
jgi:hypothetical protein